jgi:hypothetical protein
VVAAAFLTSAATSIIAGGAGATAAEASRTDQSRDGLGPNAYLIDSLLRTSGSGTEDDRAPVRGEIGLIFANGLR